jgi:hypothetical protein
MDSFNQRSKQAKGGLPLAVAAASGPLSAVQGRGGLSAILYLEPAADGDDRCAEARAAERPYSPSGMTLNRISSTYTQY